MNVRRLSAGVLCLFLALALGSDRARSATGDKQLARVKGVVGYQSNAQAPFQPIFGRLDLPDDAIAVTQANAQAVLRLRDSSEIEIGQNTTVQVGAFNAVASGRTNEIVLNNGALHFKIRHPEGGQSNYRFVTATSQIAVRGTEGFLLATADSTSLVCVSCAAGDVTAQVGSQTISVVTGQTLTVTGSSAASAATSISSSATTTTATTTSQLSQFQAGATGGIGTGTIVAGTAATVGTVAATTSNKTSGANSNGPGDQPSTSPNGPASPAPGSSPGSSPTPLASATPGTGTTPAPPGASPTPNPLIVQISYPGANAVFPVPFQWPFSQLNASGGATISAGPASVIACCSVQQSVVGGTLTGTISGQLVGPGTFQLTATSGSTTLNASFKVYGGVTVAPATLDLTALNAPKSVTVTQLPAGTPITASASCVPGAALSLLAASGVSPWTVTISGTSVPTSAPTAGAAACTITFKGGGDGPAATATLPVTITSTGITITGKQRRPL